jgi:hypothetical protein
VGEQPDTVKNYMDENNYSFPAAVEPENKLRASHAPRIPTSYLIGPDGNIIARLNDSREWDNGRLLEILVYLAGNDQLFF